MKKTWILTIIFTFCLLGSKSAFATNTISYKIQSGDTFWTLSKKFNVPYQDVLTVNPDANPYNLYIGLEVQIPVKNEEVQGYIIQSGDTFWTLSKKFNVPYSEILAMNPNANPLNLYPGLQVNIPIQTQTETETETQTNTYSYVIKGNDNFWTLSQELTIPYSEILEANPTINPRNLYPGLVVQLPRKISDSTTIPTYLADGFFPIKKGNYQPLTDTYGDGRGFNPDGTPTRKHEGIDIIAPIGTSIYSVYDGVVINKGWNTYGGWRLTIKTPDGKTAFYYAHLSKYALNIEIGSKIVKGQLIGYVGNTGYGPEGTSGEFIAHLHVGMYDITNGFIAGNPYNHLKYWETQN